MVVPVVTLVVTLNATMIYITFVIMILLTDGRTRCYARCDFKCNNDIYDVYNNDFTYLQRWSSLLEQWMWLLLFVLKRIFKSE
jgi:hypothetical protein